MATRPDGNINLHMVLFYESVVQHSILLYQTCPFTINQTLQAVMLSRKLLLWVDYLIKRKEKSIL